MKAYRNIQVIFIFAMAMCFGLSHAVYADSVSKRDVSADEILMGKAGLGGILPPTSGQALPPAAQGLLPATGPGAGDATKVLDVVLQGVSGNGLRDQKANIYDFSGSVKIRTKDAAEWGPVELGMLIEPGHELLTGADGKVSITYDTNFLNVSHIPENTKAEFRSIEPTDVYLLDGKIFNIFDGLPKGSNWKVSTPVAVSAVRGTWFVVSFQTSSGEFITATFDVPDDGQDSTVDVGEYTGGPSINPSVTVPEGNQITLKQGDPLDPNGVKGIDPKFLQQIVDFLTWLGEYRAKNGGQLPPTGSDYFSQGPDGGGNDGGTLDPQLDTGGVLVDPPPLESNPLPDEDPGGPPDCDFEECFGEEGGGGEEYRGGEEE